MMMYELLLVFICVLACALVVFAFLPTAKLAEELRYACLDLDADLQAAEATIEQLQRRVARLERDARGATDLDVLV